MIDNVIFDMDGTLIDSSPGILANVKRALTMAGYEIPSYETLRKFIGPSLYYSFTTYIGMDDETAKKAIYDYRDGFEHEGGLYDFTPYPKVVDMIKMLHSRGVKVCIASGKPHDILGKVVEKLGILPYLASYEGLASCTTKTSDKTDIVARAVMGKSAVMVGDTIFDVQSARNVGIASIGVTYGFGFRKSEDTTATYTVSTSEELYDLLDGLTK